MPQGHNSSIPPVLAATADLAVVRFHGHSDKWTSKDIYEKFGYRYSKAELKEWTPRLQQLSTEAAGNARAHEQLLLRLRPDQCRRDLIDLLGGDWAKVFRLRIRRVVVRPLRGRRYAVADDVAALPGADSGDTRRRAQRREAMFMHPGSVQHRRPSARARPDRGSQRYERLAKSVLPTQPWSGAGWPES